MAINWNPSTAQEVVQNVETLIATETGSVPLARDMGTPQDVIDRPESAAGALLQAAIIEAVTTYEPRAPLKKVTLALSTDDNAKLVVKVQLGDL